MGERMFAAKRAVSRLLAGGTPGRLVGTDDGVTMLMKQLVDADVAASAGIGLAKLAHVGTGNVLKSNGTSNVAGQIVNADVAAAAGIAKSKLAALGIVDADVAAAAGIQQSKLATLSIGNGNVGVAGLHPNRLSTWPAANYVLYDPGSGNISVAQVQDALCALNSINANKLIDLSITTGKVASRAISSAAHFLPSPAGAMAAGGWSYTSVSGSLSGLVAGQSYVIVIMTLPVTFVTATAVGGAGIGVDSAVSPSTYTLFSVPYAGAGVACTVTYVHLATAATHTYYGLSYNSTGGSSMPGWPAPVTLLALHR